MIFSEKGWCLDNINKELFHGAEFTKIIASFMRLVNVFRVLTTSCVKDLIGVK